jgi:hypothetical protein
MSQIPAKVKSLLLTFCGQPLSATQLELISQCVARYPGLSREELAATVCEWLDWRRANGGLKTRECRDLLHQLQEQKLLELPALRTGRPRGAATQTNHTHSKVMQKYCYTAHSVPYSPSNSNASSSPPSSASGEN